MKNKALVILGIVVVLFAILFTNSQFNNSPNKPAEKLKIGVIAPLSGEVAFLGEKIKNGIEVAAGPAVAKGEIEFVYEDGGIETKKALTAYQKLAVVDGVHIFIGPFGPDQILSIASNLKEDDLMLGISLCEDRLTKYPQVFCTYPSIPDQVKSALPVIKSTGVKKIGLITENSELGSLIESELRKLESEGGYKVIIVEKMKRGDKDFRTQITKIKAAGTDAVFAATLPDEGYLILKQLHELGFTDIRLAVFDAVEEVLKGIGSAAEGVYLPGHISPLFEESFTNAYKEKYDQEPDLYAALGHSVTTTLFSGLEKNKFELNGLREKLIGIKEKTAIFGFEFRPNHTVSIPVETLIFKDGKIRQI